MDEQAVRVEISAARLAGTGLVELLAFIVRALANQKYQIHTGKQTIEQLNRQHKPLSSVEVGDETLRDIKRQLKAYGVDFAVTKDANGKMSLWFKGADVERVQKALENCIADLGEAAAPHKEQESLQELCDRAKERSAVVNAERAAAPPERGERV